MIIDVKGKGKYKKTSTIQLYPNVPSIEMWPYYIYSIKITSLQSFEMEQFEYEPIEVDSTCIKNPQLNVSKGNELLELQLNKVKKGFLENENFNLKTMLSFEDSIESEDISLGHFYSLGESIYPYFSNYQFGNPLRYRRIECPYFDGFSSYFYTKKENYIKVISFEWSELKLSGWPENEIESKEMREAFMLKYQSVKETVSKLLGEPLTIQQEPDSGRIDTRWKSDSGINAYLFMFKNYNNIRLYIYKD